jgi:hypothetical protein
MFILSLLATMAFAHADAGSLPWYPLNKTVICGGTVDASESLDFHTVGNAAVLGAQSKDGRIMVYVDLQKTGQVRWLINEALTDDEYDRREAVVKTLPPADADFIRSLTTTRQTQIYSGMTDHFVNLDFTAKKRSLSLSCQEADLFRAEN